MNLDRCPMTMDEKHRMIAEAAYLRAAGRNFSGSDRLGDWLAAESAVNHSLSAFCEDATRRKSLAHYHRVGLISTAGRWWQRMKTRIEATS